MNCCRCRKLLEHTGKKTCGICIAYVDGRWFASDAIAFALVLIKITTVGHISVVWLFSLDCDLTIFIIIILKCNIYDETLKRWLFRVVKRNIWW